MFIWLEFINNNIKLNHDSVFNKSKVLYIPESAFSVDKSSRKQAIRLNFTYPSFDEIEQGIKKLSAAMDSCDTRSNTRVMKRDCALI